MYHDRRSRETLLLPFSFGRGHRPLSGNRRGAVVEAARIRLEVSAGSVHGGRAPARQRQTDVRSVSFFDLRGDASPASSGYVPRRRPVHLLILAAATVMPAFRPGLRYIGGPTACVLFSPKEPRTVSPGKGPRGAAVGRIPRYRKPNTPRRAGRPRSAGSRAAQIVLPSPRELVVC